MGGGKEDRRLYSSKDVCTLDFVSAPSHPKGPASTRSDGVRDGMVQRGGGPRECKASAALRMAALLDGSRGLDETSVGHS